ncbi:MAG: NifB/NifX family molybdenum-iron cluster-binding protein [Desulfomonilaceae bacterium]
MIKILVPLLGDDIAPRFDLAPEAYIALVDDNKRIVEERTIVLSEASAETLCRMILDERITMVICGGIEDEYYQYLVWKKVSVIDSVIGSSSKAIELAIEDALSPGSILMERSISQKSAQPT